VRSAHSHASADGALVAYDDRMDGMEDTPVIVSTAQLLTNDAGPSTADLTITAVSGAVGGTVSYDRDAGTIAFTPTANFNGTASFAYTVSDGAGREVTATAIIDVGAMNDAPVVTNTLNSRVARWEDMTQTEDPLGAWLGVVIPVYGLPPTAAVGAALASGDGVVAFAQASFGSESGLIGFNAARMYWGIDLHSAPTGIGLAAGQWREVLSFTKILRPCGAVQSLTPLRRSVGPAIHPSAKETSRRSQRIECNCTI